jgi:AraC-like DNA-binding protein
MQAAQTSTGVTRSLRVFSTAHVPATERLRAWEAHNADALIALRCRAPAGVPFRAREDNLDLGRVQLARVQSTAHVIERSRDLIEQRPTASVAVYFSIRGDALFEQAGRRRVIGPGDLLICDADGQFVRGFGLGLDELALRVDRDALPDVRPPSAGEPLIVRRGESNPYARAIGRIVGDAMSGHSTRRPDEQTVMDLLAALVTRGTARPQVMHRALACAYIEERLRDPRLSAPDVAAAVGIGVRQLTRVFAELGTTFPRHVLRRRLELAHSLLTGADAGTLVTATVATMCGFHSISRFSENFRSRFGVAPGELRRGTTSGRATRPEFGPVTRASAATG